MTAVKDSATTKFLDHGPLARSGRTALFAIVRTLVAAHLAGILARPVAAQVDALAFDSSRVPVGRVFHYAKANRDGTHATHISVYVVAVDRLESFKWDDGAREATLVGAQMDWSRFSVRRFDAWHLARGAAPVATATLEQDSSGRGVRVSFLHDSIVPVSRWPWHSYDFDFASLGFVIPHLRAPEAPFTFTRADVTWRGDTLGFADLGDVVVRYVGREHRGARTVRHYTIGGPGLRNTSGDLWVDARDAFIVEYDLPIPDEPGLRDVRLRLERTETMTPAQWEAYKRQRLGEAN